MAANLFFRVIISFLIHKLPFSLVYFYDNTLLQQVKEKMPASRKECRTITDIRVIQKTVVEQFQFQFRTSIFKEVCNIIRIHYC